MTTHRCGHLLGWAGLLATALLFATLLQAVASASVRETAQADPALTPACTTTTAALADGDDVRAAFLAQLPQEKCETH